MSVLPDDAWGLYVHVPWCRIRCPYCPFVIAPDHDAPPFGAFVDQVIRLRERRREDFPGEPVTVYLGGGTPSRLPHDERRRLLRTLVPPSVREVTVEANPEDVDGAWLTEAMADGVTRLSLGVQTWSEAHARRLGRTHTPADARRAVRHVAEAGLDSWSVDLMFGLPEQSLDDLQRDIDAVLDSGAPHVSLYGLTIEPGTPFERAVRRGTLNPADADLAGEMYAQVVARLGEAGLRRYEASNLARPGHEAVHNRGYWQGRPYLGLGPGAHSFAPDGRRWTEAADVEGWPTRDEPRQDVERPDGWQAAADRLVGAMRATDGVDLDLLASISGHRPRQDAIARLLDGGLVERIGPVFRPTPRGLDLADRVTATLVDALAPVEPDAATR